MFLLNALLSSAQLKLNKSEEEFVALVNEARTNPRKFALKHNEFLTSSAPKFLKLLSTAQPLPVLEVSEELCATASKAWAGDLNPPFPSEKFCGAASGRASGRWKTIDRVAMYYSNVMSPEYTHLGICIKMESGQEKSVVYWSKLCSFEAPKVEVTFTGVIDSSRVDFKKINTGIDASFMSAKERAMLKEINFVRCYPKVYAEIIFKEIADQSTTWQGLRHDDFQAALELIDELKAMKPLNALLPMECIYVAARAHGQDEVARGFTGHDGSDGSQPWDRIGKACKELAASNENLVGGGKGTPRAAVIQLLIDSGISSRGHRYNMLDVNWTHAACYYAGKVGSMPDCWVQNFGQKK